MNPFQNCDPVVINKYVDGDIMGNIVGSGVGTIIVADDVHGNIHLGDNSTVVILGNLKGNVHAGNVVTFTQGPDYSENKKQLKKSIKARVKEKKKWN